MLAQIEDFTFEVNDTAYDTLKRSINYRFSSMQRLGNFDDWQSVGKHEESIELNGVLIAKSQAQLDDFEKLAEAKVARTLAFSNGRCKTILILNLELEQSNFLKDGAFLKQGFKITLVVDGSGL
ncbi:MAG: phage tail protein [Campylobacterales bacterium]|nr:phage tail protein [Campylobacterales bacterium]